MSAKIPFNKYAYLDPANYHPNSNLVCHYDKTRPLEGFIAAWLINDHLRFYEQKRFYSTTDQDTAQSFPSGYVALIGVVYDLPIMRAMIEASRYLLVVSNTPEHAETLATLKEEFQGERFVVIHEPETDLPTLVSTRVLHRKPCRVVSFISGITATTQNYFLNGLMSRGLTFGQLDKIEKEGNPNDLIPEGINYLRERHTLWREVTRTLDDTVFVMNIAGMLTMILPRPTARHCQWLLCQMAEHYNTELVGVALPHGEHSKLHIHTNATDINPGAIARGFGGRGDSTFGEFVLENITLDELA